MCKITDQDFTLKVYTERSVGCCVTVMNENGVRFQRIATIEAVPLATVPSVVGCQMYTN